MPEKEFEGDITYNWELHIGRMVEGILVWTQIYGFETLPFPDQPPEDQDVTHMQSPGRTRESVPGMLPVADWSQEKQLWSQDDGDLLLFELADLSAAGARESVLVEFNLDPSGTRLRRTYRGYVNVYTPTGTVGDKEMASLSIKLQNRQADNARVIEQ